MLEYDDVANDQRRVIYQQRNELLETEDMSETIRNMIERTDRGHGAHCRPAGVGRGAMGRARAGRRRSPQNTSCSAPVDEWLKTEPELSDEDVRDRVREVAQKQYEAKLELVGPEMFHKFERNLMLQTLDQHWREHLAALDHLRQGIHLRGYAQKNPKQEYKRESFELFSDMLDRIKQDVVKIVLTVQVRSEQDVQAVEEAPPVSNVRYQHADYEQALAPASDDPPPATSPPPFTRAGDRRSAATTVPLRVGQEVQALPRPPRLIPGCLRVSQPSPAPTPRKRGIASAFACP